jgi:aminoglycoside phosphotransferase (APT) family kinase protein
MSVVEDSALDGLDLPALERFFAGHVPGFAGGLTAELLQGGRSNLTFVLTDGARSWVLRRPPLGELTPSAHDVGREYQVVAALADSGVPVARAVALAGPDVLGVPFSVVDYVDGRVIRTTEQLHALPPADIARCAYALVDVLARLHQLEPGAVGLAGFGRPEGYLARQVRRWYDQWRRVQTRPLEDIDHLHARLAGACPAESGASIVHGDYRIDNTILDADDPSCVRAVVDWELSTLGDPLSDAALMCVYRDPSLDLIINAHAAWTSPQLPVADELADRYSKISGQPLAHWNFYMALAYFKLAIIAAGIDFRRRMSGGDDDVDASNRVGETVAPLIARGLTELRST